MYDNRPLVRGTGCATIIGLVVLYFIVRSILPHLSTILLYLITLAFVALIAFVVALMIISFRSNNKEKEEKAAEEGLEVLDEENATVLNNAKASLIALRGRVARISNSEIRSAGNDVCEEADRILGALRKNVKQIPTARQFWNYYLPSLGTIVTKYEKIEKSGVPDEKMTAKVLTYLKEIKTALEKLYKSLFDDDKLDLSVEMEAMKMAMQRDGLMSNDETEVKNGEETINLTL